MTMMMPDGMSGGTGRSRKRRTPNRSIRRAANRSLNIGSRLGSSPSRSSSRRSAPTPKRTYSPPPPPPAPSYTPQPAPAPSNSYTPPRSSTGRVNSYSSGGSSSGGSSGGSSYSAPAPAPKPPPPPKPPAVSEWLSSDTGWQDTRTQLQKAIADYKARMQQQRGQYNTEYQTNLDNLGQSRKSALEDLENDFAGRGLIQSGLYGDSVSELQSDYDARQAALEQGKSSFLADLQSAFQDFRGEQDLTRTQAKRAALNRRAQKFNL